MSTKKALQCLAVGLFCVLVYYVAVQYRQARIVGEPSELAVKHQAQRGFHEPEAGHRKALSIDEHILHASTPTIQDSTPTIQDSTSQRHADAETTLELTSTVKKLPNSRRKGEYDFSSRSKSMGRCIIDQESIKSIRNFVFFIGYPRSGHSIVASFLDAHPHMIVTHEFSVFSKWPQFKSEYSGNARVALFNQLANSSHWESLEGERSGKYVNKGYSLDTSSPWHGKCDRYLEVIGDKRAGGTCEAYLSDPEAFEQNYKELLKMIQLPIRVVHVVRNPYDLIATSLLYEAARLKNGGKVSGDNAHYVNLIKNHSKHTNYTYTYTNRRLLEERVHVIMRLAEAVTNLTKLFGEENVLEVHNCDIVTDPIKHVNLLCQFNGVECFPDYVKACVDKTFSKISRSRDYVTWPANVVKVIEQYIKQFPFFERYSLHSDC